MWRPMEGSLGTITLTIMVLMKLHNICLDNDLKICTASSESDLNHDELLFPLAELNDNEPEPGRRRDLERSPRREKFADQLERAGMRRPPRSTYSSVAGHN